jgi:hypothetical protein
VIHHVVKDVRTERMRALEAEEGIVLAGEKPLLDADTNASADNNAAIKKKKAASSPVKPSSYYTQKSEEQRRAANEQPRFVKVRR